MYKYVQKLKEQFDLSGFVPMFEIEVVDYLDYNEYVTCGIYFEGNSIVAERDSVSLKEENSEFIARTKITVEEGFTLDYHLEALLEAVLKDIEDGDLYDLPYGE